MSKSELSTIEQSVWESIDRYFPDPSSTQLVVAVSGGMDSMCLLHIFKRLEIPVVVSHINYQKREDASYKDAELVAHIARKWGFKCHVTKADSDEAEGQNFQRWARDFRYQEFRSLVKKYSADGIAVAHHEDDQVETILQKIFRGAGLPSWSAMDVWDGEIFRPLLDFSRAQIEAYVQNYNIPYRTDESNLKADFARNLLRNEWLDALTKFFPGWKQNVLRVEQQADNYKHALKWIADRITRDKKIVRHEFDLLQPGLQKALLLYLVKQNYPVVQITKESLERVDELATLQTGKAIELTSEVSILRDREYYVIEKNEEEVFKPLVIELNDIDAARLDIAGASLRMTDFGNPDFDNALYLDAEKIHWPVKVRRWQHGDQIQPLGMQGHQQVAEHLTNRKVSAAYKKKVMVVESFEETICAVIFPPIKNQTPPGTISEKVKCNPDTKKCLEIKYSE
jgi:tRNA(Ile)-lysidine synthase